MVSNGGQAETIADQTSADQTIADQTVDEPEDWQPVPSGLSKEVERFQPIADCLEDVFWLSSPTENRLIYASPSYEEVWGRSIAALYANWHEWIEAVHPDDRGRVEKALSEAILQGTHYNQEYRILRPDGAVRWIRDRGQLLTDAQGNVVQMSGIAQDITNRKQSEEALRQSEERYRSLVSVLTSIVWTLDQQGEVVTPQPDWQAYTGQSWQQYQGFGWLEAIHADDRAQVLDCWLQARDRQLPYFSSGRLWHDPSQEYRYFEARGVPLYHPDGKIREWVGTVTDVHDRKQTEDSLRRSQWVYRAIGETIDYGIWICDPDGRNTYASDSFLKLVGITQAECSDFGWGDVLHPDDAERTIAAWQECARSGNFWDIEHRYRGVDGEWHPVLARGIPIRDEAGKILCWAGINLDISRLKQAEANLRESESRFRQLADSMPQIIWTARPDGYLDYYNQRWYEFTGFVEGEGGDSSWQPILHPDDARPCVDAWYGAVRSGQPYQIEYRFWDRHTGRYRWFLGRALPVHNEDGQVLRWLGTCTDIDDQKQAEAEIRQLNETLEERVNQRTAQLEVANKELEAFSYSVSHDLRAPLRHIAGFVDLLQKRLGTETLDATSLRYLETIARTTKQAGVLIDDLLSFSRMGRSEMRQMPVSSDRLVQEVLRDLASEAGSRTIRWQIESLPEVRADLAMLRLVWRNLVGNAIKYTRSRPAAEIAIGSQDRPQETIFFISDNGVGFDMRYVHKLFGVFQRLHSDPTFEGTGIGLANVQRIVARHGGRTWAEGAVDRGATFFFSLPKRECEENECPS